MAKAKKHSEQTAAAGEKKPAAKKAAHKKPTKPESGPPVIDTTLAAQTAAKMLVNRDVLSGAAESAEKRESGSFKKLKESLNKPAAHGPASFLQSTAPQKKLNLPFGQRNQVGHNQTFGADVNRSGVPRRTGG